MRGGSLVKLGLGAALAVVLALALAQLLLPRIAAKAVKDKVSRYGEVRSVSVQAFPAVELLWGEADSVAIDTGAISIAPGQLVGLLLEANQASKLRVDASEVRVQDLDLGAGPLLLGQASLRKRADAVHATVLLTHQALDAALPAGVSAEILSSSQGQIQVRATGSLFGFKASVNAVIEAVDGKLELIPKAGLLGGLAALTLFDEPKLQILSVQATRQGASAWELRIDARLR